MTDKAIVVPNDSDDLFAWLKGSEWTKVNITVLLGSMNSTNDQKRAVHDPKRPPPVLYAIISTWHESDIVEAAVKNCFVHGCERVYLIDNDSPDGTRELGVKAGAELALNFTTEFYRDELRVNLINQTMREITEREKHPRLWWLTLDCDEFIHLPHQRRLIDFLAEQKDEINTVGCYSFDHYPTDPISNVPGFHPAVFQPFGHKRHLLICKKNHWKHPLIRVDNGVFDICQTRGLHAPFTIRRKPLYEPMADLWLHHFMFRNRDFTEARLRLLCAPKDELGGHRRCEVDDNRLKGEGAIKRFRNLDLIYQKRWNEAEICHAQAWKQKIGIPVKHWSKTMDWDHYQPLLWHGEQEAIAAAYAPKTERE